MRKICEQLRLSQQPWSLMRPTARCSSHGLDRGFYILLEPAPVRAVRSLACFLAKEGGCYVSEPRSAPGPAPPQPSAEEGKEEVPEAEEGKEEVPEEEEGEEELPNKESLERSSGACSSGGRVT